MKENTKHTPGPWQFISWGKTIVINSPTITGVAHINPGHFNGGIPDKKDIANACLIAAAPDLLVAAIRALNELSVNGHGNVSEPCENMCAICDASKVLRAVIAKAERR